METILLIAFIVLHIFIWGLLIVSILMLERNKRVYKLRTWINNTVSQNTQDDIHTGYKRDDFLWRHKAAEKVTYDQMMKMFWKPVKVESFYHDLTFLNTTEKCIEDDNRKKELAK